MSTYVDRFHVGAATHIGPLSVFPVWAETRCRVNFVLPTADALAVQELERPEVGSLRIANQGQLPLIVPEGVIFGGGWQSRVVAEDRLVMPGQERTVSVNCVERGRWNGGQLHRVDGRAPVSVIASLRGVRPTGRRAAGQQQEVWEKVSRLERHYGTRRTNSLQEIMADELVADRPGRAGGARAERAIDERLIEEVKAFASRRLPGQSGVLVGIGGHPVMLEQFGSSTWFRRQLAAILQATLLDAVTVPFAPTPGRNARAFAEEVMFTPMELRKAYTASVAFAGRTSLADVRSFSPMRTELGAFHLSVINRQHELALAA